MKKTQMRIKFDMDRKMKIVNIYISEKEMTKLVKRTLKEHPEWTNKEMGDRLGFAITDCFIGAFEYICRIIGDDLKDYKPGKFISYKHEREIPMVLREANL